jgi:hypothetical protein
MTARSEPPPSAEELSALRDKLCRRRENLVYEMVRSGIESGFLTQLAGTQAGIATIDLMTGNNHRPRRWS